MQTNVKCTGSWCSLLVFTKQQPPGATVTAAAAEPFYSRVSRCWRPYNRNWLDACRFNALQLFRALCAEWSM